MDSINEEGLTSWIVAAKKGRVALLKFLLSLPTVNAEFCGGVAHMNALHFACRKGHTEIVEMLLAHGSSVDAQSLHNWTPLHFAVSEGHLDVAKLLVCAGASPVGITSFGATPLSIACGNKLFSTAQWLLELPDVVKHINDADQGGWTALHKAARQGDVPLLQLLTSQESIDLNRADASGSTAFDEADRSNMTDAAVFLWRAGARGRVHRQFSSHLSAIRWVRPRVLDPPEPRFHVAVCSSGSTIFAAGGVGLPKGFVNSDPENRIPDSIKTMCHTDLFSLDLDEWTLECVLPINDSLWRLQREWEWDASAMGRFISLADPLTAEAQFADDVDCVPCIVKASAPFRRKVGFGYFEVHILDLGVSGIVTVGLTDDAYPVERKQPGWEAESYALHGDDGAVFHNNGNGKSFCEPFCADDVIGCGINWTTSEVFFTRNGRFLGVAYRGPKLDEYWACVGLETKGARLRVNFGTVPFHFSFQIPTLRWRALSQTGALPPAMLYSRFVKVSHERRLILLPDHRYGARGYVWSYELDSSRWSRTHATGEPCIMHSNSHVAIVGSHVWVYNPKDASQDQSRSDLPSLFRLDLLRWRWDQIVPIPSLDSADSAIPADNQRKLSALLSGALAAALMVKANSRLHFFTVDSLISVHPISLDVEREAAISGFRPTSSLYSALARKAHVVTFGGWDELKQRADTYVLDLQVPLWYKPHISAASVLPRPRNLHSAALVSLSQVELVADRDEATPDDPAADKTDALVHLFGWNGRNCMDDFDVLLPKSRETVQSGDDLDWSLSKRSLCDVNLQFPEDPEGAGDPIMASRIILSCRSSRFKAEFQSRDALDTETVETGLSPARRLKASFEIRGTSKRLFSILLTLLYTDRVDAVRIGEDATLFVDLVRQWAPEHERRVIEELALTMVREPSHMSRDLAFAVQNPRFSDLTLVVDGKSVVAHKAILCSRSAYFRGLCLSGLRESREKTIPLTDTPFEAFLVVLEYLYTRRLNFELLQDNVVEVFLLSCRYSLRRLKVELEAIIGSNLSADNVCSILLVADQHDATTLRKTCATFISENLADVRSTSQFADLASEIRALVPAM